MKIFLEFEKPLMYSTRQKRQCKERKRHPKETSLKKKKFKLWLHQSNWKFFLTTFSEKKTSVSFLILQNFSRLRLS